MPQTPETPALPSAKDLAWALFQIMDGTKEHDLVAMTGLPEAECAKVFEIYSCAKVFEIYSQVRKVYYPSHWLPMTAVPSREETT